MSSSLTKERVRSNGRNSRTPWSLQLRQSKVRIWATHLEHRLYREQFNAHYVNIHKLRRNILHLNTTIRGPKLHWSTDFHMDRTDYADKTPTPDLRYRYAAKGPAQVAIQHTHGQLCVYTWNSSWKLNQHNRNREPAARQYSSATFISLRFIPATKNSARFDESFSFIFLYLLTPRSRVLLEKLTGSQLVKKLSTFYGTQKFITVFKIGRLLSLSWVRSIQSMPHITLPEDPL